MDINEMIYSKPFFAWHPVSTKEGVWLWWQWVRKEIDERPLIYCGLPPRITYYKLKDR